MTKAAVRLRETPATQQCAPVLVKVHPGLTPPAVRRSMVTTNAHPSTFSNVVEINDFDGEIERTDVHGPLPLANRKWNAEMAEVLRIP